MSSTRPVRTCVGCRERTTKSNLLRVVADLSGPQRSVVPDVHARRPGRGAHLHPSLACLDLADRRSAFPRALRLEGPLDVSAIRSWISTRSQSSPGDLGPAHERLARPAREWSSGS
ncbi:MAG TPA: YlxR family protein [Nocardioidaceae bacterium]|nr:YlxR family protein [Nocardioidaceae bacterium]